MLKFSEIASIILVCFASTFGSGCLLQPSNLIKAGWLGYFIGFSSSLIINHYTY